MARSLEQALAELNPTYAGSRDILSSRIGAIGGEVEAGVSQADARLEQANTNILNGARRRGVAFGGIPLGEQAQYAATEYAPAVANLRSAGLNKELSLQESLQALGREQRTQAQGLVDGDLARDFQDRQFAEQQRQFNENMRFQQEQADRAAREAAASRAAQSADLSKYFAGAGAGAAPSSARMARGANGGFGFFDASGRPINAAQYAQLTGTGYRQLLSQMAGAGDRNAATALGYVGNDARYSYGGGDGNVIAALNALGASNVNPRQGSSASNVLKNARANGVPR